jgi:3-deoxy-D-manno-octulosonic-acid transferase
VSAELPERRAALQVQNREQLLERMRELLADPAAAREMGARGQRWVESHQGVTAQVAEQITRRMVR